jgi:hypothetical protein
MGSGASTLLVGEVIIWNRVLTTDERTTAEGYLAWQYLLQTNLPDDHPYKGGITPEAAVQLDSGPSIQPDINSLTWVNAELLAWYKATTLAIEANIGVRVALRCIIVCRRAVWSRAFPCGPTLLTPARPSMRTTPATCALPAYAPNLAPTAPSSTASRRCVRAALAPLSPMWTCAP